MSMAYRFWPYSSIVLAVAGGALIGMGFYFMVLRPALLPEDVRYMDLPAAQLDAVRPHLDMWLTHVFSVMGGYIVATGVLTITVAATSFRTRDRIAVAGALAAGITSIGWMAVVNFEIASDFKWVLLGVALVWVCGLALFWFERAVGGGR
jgi:hypothetical protein